MSNNLPNRHYAIMDWPQPPEAWDSVVETPSRCRRSTNGKVLMKFDGLAPPYFAGVETYTHAEIIEILDGPEWNDPDSEDPGS